MRGFANDAKSGDDHSISVSEALKYHAINYCLGNLPDIISQGWGLQRPQAAREECKGVKGRALFLSSPLLTCHLVLSQVMFRCDSLVHLLLFHRHGRQLLSDEIIDGRLEEAEELLQWCVEGLRDSCYRCCHVWRPRTSRSLR